VQIVVIIQLKLPVSLTHCLIPSNASLTLPLIVYLNLQFALTLIAKT